MIRALEALATVGELLSWLGEHGRDFVSMAYPKLALLGISVVVAGMVLIPTRERWLPLLPVLNSYLSKLRIWLFGLNDLASIAAIRAVEKRSSSNPTELRESLEFNWELQLLFQLVDGRYLQAWWLDSLTGRLEALSPERVLAVPGFARAGVSKIFVEQGKIDKALRRYDSDCRIARPW